MTKESKPNTSRWTVSKFLDEIYVPTKMKSMGLTHRTCKKYRQAVNLLERFHGQPILCVEVNDELLEKFVLSLVKRGLRIATAETYKHDVKSIVRLWNPELFKNDLGRNAVPAFPDADDSSTLDYVFAKKYIPERLEIASETTIKRYALSMRYFGQFLGRPATGRDLRDEIVGRFLRWLVEVKKLKAVSANGYVVPIKALWTWMAKKRMVKAFPTIGELPEPGLVPVAWSKSELQKLMRACRMQTRDIRGVPAAHYWVAFHNVLWDTGARSGEMLALKFAWIDWETSILSVPGEVRKGRQQSMVYRLKPETIESVRAIIEPKRELIFVRKNWRSSFWKAYRRLIEDADLPYVKGKCGPQKMRRTFASHIEAAGGNATKALKHRDRRVTEDSYLDPRITEVESENEKLFPLDGDEPQAT